MNVTFSSSILLHKAINNGKVPKLKIFKIQNLELSRLLGNLTLTELMFMEIDGMRELDPKFYKAGIVDRDRVGVKFPTLNQR